MMFRRAGLALAVSLVSITLGSPAVADDQEYGDRADAAVSSGVRIVVSTWDGVASAGIYEIEHIGTMEFVSAGGSWLVVGEGSVTRADGGGVALAGWSTVALSDRYQIRSLAGDSMLGRATQVIEVREGDLLRCTIQYDKATGAPLSTRIFDGDGNLFRSSTMVSFGRSNMRLYEELVGAGAYDVVMAATLDSNALPETAAGYAIADVYEAVGGAQQVFYTDGLFSFSVFELDGDVALSEFQGASEVEIGLARYSRSATPTAVSVSWVSGGSTYVLVGDLPPDHLEAVLAELPRPTYRNMLSRWWRRIFG